MTEFVWTPTSAKKVKPGDVVRGVVREPGDAELKVLITDRFDGLIYLYADGQPDAVVFLPDAPLELRVDLDAWIRRRDAAAEARERAEVDNEYRKAGA